MQKKRKHIVLCTVLFTVSLVFYLFWYLLDGVILTEDAWSYINMQFDREPGYCLYLLLFRKLFGAGIGLHAAVIGQGVIAAAAACMVTVGLTRLFSLNWIGSIGILAIQYGITLLNRFVAHRRYSYFNSIETEGLAYSLWIFYFLCILGILYKKDKKSLIGAVVWSIVLICIRKQMLITIVILFITIFFSYLRKSGWKKACIWAVLSGLLCLSGTRFAECGYNWFLRGTFMPHTGDSSFVLGTELYLAADTMADVITDDNQRKIFQEILKQTEDNGYRISYADKGWQALVDHYSNSYDRIKFDIMMPAVRANQEERGLSDEEKEMDYDLIVGAMMRALFIACLPNMIKLYCSNIVDGFVTTVLKVHSVLNWVALGLYLCYIGNIVLWYRIGKKNEPCDFANPMYFALLVLLAIAVNVCFTSLTIYCQMRYMLYNTGLFYQAWWIMVIKYAALWCRRRNENRGFV